MVIDFVATNFGSALFGTIQFAVGAMLLLMLLDILSKVLATDCDVLAFTLETVDLACQILCENNCCADRLTAFGTRHGSETLHAFVTIYVLLGAHSDWLLVDFKTDRAAKILQLFRTCVSICQESHFANWTYSGFRLVEEFVCDTHGGSRMRLC